MRGEREWAGADEVAEMVARTVPSDGACHAGMMPHSVWPVAEPNRMARVMVGMQRRAARGWNLFSRVAGAHG
jgi:hypothetical protein